MRLRSSVFFALALCAIVLLGAGLRLYSIGTQVLVDDEWHGMYYAIGKSYAYLLTHFSIPGATCIPLNVYQAWLLKTAGWNEVWMRLPSLASGILGVAVLPLLLGPLFRRRVAILFALLLAISPFLVFYSRVCRPYSLVTLLAATSMLAGCRWLRDGTRRHGGVYAVTGALAVQAHLFAIGAVAAPIAYALCAKLFARRRGDAPGRFAPSPSMATIVRVGLVLTVFAATLTGPALVDSARTTMPSLIRKDHVTWATIQGAAGLLAGVDHPAWEVFFVLLLLTGLAVVWKRDPLVGGVLTLAIALTAISLAVAAPHSLHSPIVLSRYSVALFPLGYLLVAVGWTEAVARLLPPPEAGRAGSSSAPACILIAAVPATLLVAGPLPHLYASGSSFMNHTAFQQSYAPVSWEESYTRDMTPADFNVDLNIRAQEVSPFYQSLGNDPGRYAIIEYPMLVGDHFTPLYYYQHFHRKRVLVGYTLEQRMRETPARGLHVYGNMYVDEVLGLAPDPTRLRFRNLIRLTDVAALRSSPARYVVLHKRFEAGLPQIYGPTPCLASLVMLYEGTFGSPAYEDAGIVVFEIKPDGRAHE